MAIDRRGSSTSDGEKVTPTGRVEAMEKRLDATLGAVKTVPPALAKFYNSLSDEEKARFNSLIRYRLALQRGVDLLGAKRNRSASSAVAPEREKAGRSRARRAPSDFCITRLTAWGFGGASWL
jgi:hypothetical protein